MITNTLKWLRGGALALLAILIAACGGESGSDKGGTAAKGQSVNEPFVVAIRQVGEIFDPTSVLPAEISSVAFNIYDWLIDYNPDGSVKPGLAESWTLSPDAKSLTLNLRQNAVFHDGTPVTAEDVVFSWERLDAGGFSSRLARSLKSIEAVDEYTVQMEFGAPELGLIAAGAFPVLSKDYHERVGEQTFKEQPVGTGPYRFGELARGQHIDLVRFEDYWGDKPEIKNVRMKFVTEDTTRVAQLRTGEADLAMQIPYPLVPEVEQDPGLDTEVLTPGGSTIFLALKTDNPESPWADRRVREAMALAIDHKAISEQMLRGYPKHYPFLAPGDLGFDPELEPYGYDPERAKELLAEAGATDLEFDMPYIAGATTGLKETAEAIALYFNKVGIKAVARPLEGTQFIRYVLQASKNPDEDYVALFLAAIAGRNETSLGLVTQFSHVTPFAWYAHPEINRMALKVGMIPDETARGEAIKELGRAVHEDIRYIPLWTSSHIYGMKACVDFTPTLGNVDLMLLRDVSIARCQQPDAQAANN